MFIRWIQFGLRIGLVALYLSASSWSQDLPPAEQIPILLPSDPPVLEQMPSVPAVVTYRNGDLTIWAQPAALSDVLYTVGAQTGTLIEVPPGDDEQVFGVFGPGRPREIVALLLNGSRFNYVLMGSSEDPNGLGQVLLSTRHSTLPAQKTTTRLAVLPSKPTDTAAQKPVVLPKVEQASGPAISETTVTSADGVPHPFPTRGRRRVRRVISVTPAGVR